MHRESSPLTENRPVEEGVHNSTVKRGIRFFKPDDEGRWEKMKDDVCYYTRFLLVAGAVYGACWVFRIWTKGFRWGV
jgi:hypothetical protein